MEPRHESLERFDIQAKVAHGRGNRPRMVGISSQVNADVRIPYPLVSEQVVTDCLATRLNFPVMVGLVFIQVVWVTMVYAPIAAFLVELFPARIRYTSMTLPYHLGNGEFGGFTPLIFFGIYAATGGNLYAALIWPIAVPIMTFLIGMKYLPETKDTKIWEEVTPTPASGGASTPMGFGADTTTMK